MGVSRAHERAVTVAICTGDAFAAATIARLTAGEAMVALTEGRSDDAQRAFQATFDLEPTFDFPADVRFPRDLEIAFDTARTLPYRTRTALGDIEGFLLVDGQRTNRIPEQGPTFIQVVAPDGTVPLSVFTSMYGPSIGETILADHGADATSDGGAQRGGGAGGDSPTDLGLPFDLLLEVGWPFVGARFEYTLGEDGQAPVLSATVDFTLLYHLSDGALPSLELELAAGLPLFGGPHHVEAHVAGLVRLNGPDLGLFGGLSYRYSTGEGFSFSIGGGVGYLGDQFSGGFAARPDLAIGWAF